MENGDSNYADSGAAAGSSCGCAGCGEAWREAWALERIGAAERDCGPLSHGERTDLLQDQGADDEIVDGRDDAARLVLAVEGLRLREARIDAEQAVEMALAEAARLRPAVEKALKAEAEGPRYEHPPCRFGEGVRK